MRWIAKACLQTALAALPWGEQINHRLQRVNARRRRRLSIHDARRTETIEAVRTLEAVYPIEDAVVVEVGTGWDALPTLCLVGAGAARVHTFDHQRHLRPDLMAAAAASVATVWPRLWPLSASSDLSAMLRQGRIAYNAPGDACRTGLPDRSVDVFFSYAVLEHVPEKVVADLITEARRVLKPGGVFYALIGLHDHFNGFDASVSKVNFLRYPEWIWRLLSKNRIGYHNRLRESDFLRHLAVQGGQVVHRSSVVAAADLAAVRSMRLSAQFVGRSPEDLATTRSELIVQFLDRVDDKHDGGQVLSAATLELGFDPEIRRVA